MEFVERDLNDFKNSIRDVFNLLSINGKYSVIGSSSIKNILYNSDFDLMEFDDFKGHEKTQLKYIQKRFLDKFEKAKETKHDYITDFKCGLDSDGEPLRWSYEDMKNDYKVMANHEKKTFEEALLDKSTIKMDLISFIDGVLVEFSENFYFKFGKGKDAITNFKKEEMTTKKILESIKNDFKIKIKEKKLMKALKRKFAYHKLKDIEGEQKMLLTLTDFFNSEAGRVSKYVSDVETILLLLEKYPSFNIDDVKNNLQNIKQGLSYAYSLESSSDFIDKICKCKTVPPMIKKMNLLINYLNKFIYLQSKNFFQSNKFSMKKI
jgi:hypothetical protein